MQSCVHCELEELAAIYDVSRGRSLKPDKLVMRAIAGGMRRGEMHDSHEFFVLLTNDLLKANLTGSSVQVECRVVRCRPIATQRTIVTHLPYPRPAASTRMGPASSSFRLPHPQADDDAAVDALERKTLQV